MRVNEGARWARPFPIPVTAGYSFILQSMEELISVRQRPDWIQETGSLAEYPSSKLTELPLGGELSGTSTRSQRAMADSES